MKKAGTVFITLGLLLMAAAFGLIVHNRIEADEAGRNAEGVLAELSGVMQERPVSAAPAEALSATAEVDKTVPVMHCEKCSYDICEVCHDAFEKFASK